MIDNKMCQYIKSIAKNRSFTKASSELFISQPSLSRYVKSLEKKLGVELFNRNKIPLELTYEGERFMHYIAEFEDLSNKMEKDFFELSGRTGDYLSIGAIHYFGTYFLPQIIPIFLSQYHKIRLDIQEHDAKFIEEALIDERIDLFLSFQTPKNREINYCTIACDRILLVTRKTPLLEKKYDLLNNSINNPTYINFLDLKNETFILLHSGQGMRAIADNVFRFHNFSPHSIIQTTTVASTLSLVIGSYGFTFFGEKALKNVTFDTPLAYFSYDGIESMPINIAYLKGKKGCSIKGSMIDNFCECAKSILDNGLNAIER